MKNTPIVFIKNMTIKLSDKFLMESMYKRISSLEIQLGQKDSYIQELESNLNNSNQPASTRIANLDYERFKEIQKEEYFAELLDKNSKLKNKIKDKDFEIRFLKEQLDKYISKIGAEN